MTTVNGTNNTANTPPVVDSESAKSRSQLSGDFDTFLLMLTTQLKHQDPSDPLDTAEFTSQLVQFATVEQSIATNENLEKLLAVQQQTEIANAAAYIGKYVEASGNEIRLNGGVAPIRYDLPAGVDKAEITITDAKGVIVYQGEVPHNVGKNDVLWDGTSNKNLPDGYVTDGIYKVAVIAKDGSNNRVTEGVTTYTTGFISAVDIQDGKAVFRIGDIELALDKIKTVRDPYDVIGPGGSGEPDETEEPGEVEEPGETGEPVDDENAGSEETDAA